MAPTPALSARFGREASRLERKRVAWLLLGVGRGATAFSIVLAVSVERRLAAVMFTDIEGFTSMMQGDEKSAFASRDRYVEVLEEQHAVFGGDIVQFFGDGSLSVFASSADAVSCAVAVQQKLHAAPQVPIRIGIHLGDVVLEQTGLVGDAVNVASRIESFAIAGAVLVSDSVADQLRNQPSFDLVDLGRFHLKNVGRPYSIYAVEARGVEVPTPDFLRGKGEHLVTIPASLPERFAPLVGRDADLTALTDLMRHHRLVTITGPAGIGKTSTAIDVAHKLTPEYLDGISYVSLADVIEPRDVMPAVAEALDVKEHETRTMKEGVFSLIGHRKVLLVLDNLEQVIESAPEIGELLNRCSELRLLVTSRTPMRIEGEREYQLKPLALPPADEAIEPPDLTSYPAIELFVQRARSVKPSFDITPENATAVARICRRMDGLPLAIELAAARIRILTPVALSDRLEHALDVLTGSRRDMPERQRTLRAAIGWSHSLLNDQEKRLFRCMAVFVGGVTFDDIAAVCGDPSGTVMQELESLVDKALVVIDGERFSTLQTVRVFAEERLEESGEAETLRTRHAEHFVGLARAVRDGLEGTEQLSWMERGLADEPNIQVALDHLAQVARRGDTRAGELGMTAVGDLWLYWHIRGKHLTSRENATRFLSISDEQTLGRAWALNTAGIASWALGRPHEAIEELSEAHAIAERQSDAYLTCTTLLGLIVAYLNVDVHEAVLLCSKAITSLHDLDYPLHLGFALTFDGMARALTGSPEEAAARLQEALAIQEPRGDHEGAGMSLAGLAGLAKANGEVGEATELYERAREAFRAVGDRAEEARVLGEVAWTYLADGQLAEAHSAFAASAQAYEDLGSPPGIGTSLIGLAAVTAESGYMRRAVAIASAADRLSDQEGVVVSYAENSPGRLHLDAARAALSADALEQARADGAKLSTRDAIDMAVSEPSTAPD